MKNFFAALIISLALGYTTSAYSNAENLSKITGLKNLYKLDARIDFKVESLSELDQKFICNVEKLTDTEWHQILYHCEANSPMKATRLYSLPSKGSETIGWEPQKEKYIKISDGTYRFRLDFEGDQDIVTPIYSDPFQIK